MNFIHHILGRMKDLLGITDSHVQRKNTNETVDEEYIALKEKSLESERKIQSILSKIMKLEELMKEASLLQMDISYSLNELCVGDLYKMQKLNSFNEIVRELILQQEEHEKIINETIMIPMTEFMIQFKLLKRRDYQLDKRRKEMDKRKKKLIHYQQKQSNTLSLSHLEREYSSSKDSYVQLRNELSQDRTLLLKILPSVSLEITNQFVREGWGCLSIKHELWKRINDVFSGIDPIPIDEYCHLITESFSSESFQTSNTSNSLKSNVFHARVLYDYDPKNEKELKLREGEWIHVLSTDGYWWEGEQNGKIGVFPSNYVVKDINI